MSAVPLRALCLAIAMVIVAPICGRAAEPVQLDDLISAYRRHYDRIQTIRLEATTNVKSVVPEDELFRVFRAGPSLPKKYTVVLHRDGRTYFADSNPEAAVFPAVFDALTADYPAIQKDFDTYFQIPFARVRELANKEWEKNPHAPPRICLYDGQKLWDYEPELRLTSEDVARQSFSIVNTDRLDHRYVPKSILDDLLLTFPMPGLASEDEHHRESRLPDLFMKRTFRILDATESVDGVQCIVAEATGVERVYFDAEHGYAVRKRQWFRDGEVIFEFTAGEFQPVGDGLWFPRSAAHIQYGFKEQADGKYFAKPVHRSLVTIDEINLNQPEHLQNFSVDVPAGAWVNDQTLSPVDKQGNPTSFPKYPDNVVPAVTYLKPAGQADVDKAVRDAQKRAAYVVPGAPLQATGTKARFTSILIWFCVGMAAVTAAVAIYRRATHRPG